MKNKNRQTLYLVQSALIAGIYVAVTYAASPISYGSVQFRISEALTVLPVLTPAAIPGLAIGCLISNLGSPLGIVDIICGTLATLLAAICTRLTRKVLIKKLPLLPLIFPVLFNGLIIGAEIAFFLPEGFSWLAFLTSGVSVALGQAGVCYILGLPLYISLNKTGIFKN